MNIQVTGVIVEDGRILLQDHDADIGRSWSLPGGQMQQDETLAEALIREMLAGFGADVSVGSLLYVCDHLPGDESPGIHMTFEATLIGGDVGDVVLGADTRPIRGAQFVAITDLPGCGFTSTFTELALAGFPGAGSYMGAKSNIGL